MWICENSLNLGVILKVIGEVFCMKRRVHTLRIDILVWNPLSLVQTLSLEWRMIQVSWSSRDEFEFSWDLITHAHWKKVVVRAPITKYWFLNLRYIDSMNLWLSRYSLFVLHPWQIICWILSYAWLVLILILKPRWRHIPWSNFSVVQLLLANRLVLEP